MIKCAKHGSFSGENGSYFVIIFYICTLFGIKLEKMREGSLRNHVIATAQKLFYKEGVRAVTMDKVAQSLRMSKRTLYELFTDKEDLLVACVAASHKDFKDKMRKASKPEDTVIDIILRTFSYRLKWAKNVSPTFFSEADNYPKVVALFENHREDMRGDFCEFYHRGVQEGLFIDRLNPQLLYLSFITMMPAVRAYSTKDPLRPFDFFLNTYFVHVRGFATEKGRQLLDEFVVNYRREHHL